MDREELIRRLNRLTEREREVLSHFCKGMKYIKIGDAIGLSEGGIKTHMYNIFSKLELSECSRGDRRKILLEEFCPILHSGDLQIPPPETDVLEPMPEEAEQEIDSLQYPLIVLKPKPIKPPDPEERPSCFRRLITPFVVFVLLLFAGIGIYAVVTLGPEIMSGVENPNQLSEENETDFINNNSANHSDEISQNETMQIAESTQQPSSTIPPTFTMDVPTKTILPSITPTDVYIPSISLPFSDNFDAGLDQAWDVFSGSWITSDGWLTIMRNDGDWDWIVLNEPSWQDYKIQVTVHIHAYGAANQEPLAVGVRINRAQPEFLGFYVDTLSRGGWSLIGLDRSHNSRISDGGAILSIPEDFNLEIEVIGNQFIAYVNGREYHRITISGFETGGIGLGIICNVETGCPKFDDFSVEPID